MSQERIEDSKYSVESIHLESLAHTGFSDDEIAILRKYEGSKGKKVIRKVLYLLTRLRNLLTTSSD
jgi:hypothetical protein